MAKRGRRPIPKTQKEISIAQHTPYVNPEDGNTRGNPNDDAYNKHNRGNQLSWEGETVKPFSVGIKDIDESIKYYFDNIIKPSVVQNGQRLPIPIIYGSPERWKSVQKDGYYRDKKGKIMAPLIMYKRNDITKNYSIGNKLDANNPHNFAVWKRKYSKKNEYDNFNILNNRAPEENFYVVIIPDYVTLTYSYTIFTYYVEQMNKIIEAINYASESYWGFPERFKFRARIDTYTTNVTINQGQERVVKTNFNIKMYGYIISDTVNKKLSNLNKLNNITSLKIDLKEQIVEPYIRTPDPDPSVIVCSKFGTAVYGSNTYGCS